MLEQPVVRLQALGSLAQHEAAARLLEALTQHLGVHLRVHSAAGGVDVVVVQHEVLVAEQRVESESLHEQLADLHHHHHAELLLAALLLDEGVEGLTLLLSSLAHVVHQLLAHCLVDLVCDAALEATGELARSELAVVVVVLLAALLLEALANAVAEVVCRLVHRHVLRHPFIGNGGDDLLLNLEYRGTAFHLLGALVTVVVKARALEGEFLRLANVHADDVLVEAVGHIAGARGVGAALGSQARHRLAVLGTLELHLHAVALRNRMRVVGDVLGVMLRRFIHMALDLVFAHLERLHRDGNRLIGRELVVGLREHHDGERELAVASDGAIMLGLRRVRGREVLLVDSIRNKTLDRLLLHDGVEILDAHLLLGDLSDRLVLFRAQAHLLSELDVGVLQHLVHLNGRCDAFETQLAVIELSLSNLH